MNARLEIVTLGGLSIQLDGKPVAGFVSRKVEALLVYLVANPREHSREVLGQFLWDDLPQDRTLANLRMALSSLQQQLASFLVVTRNTLAINPDSIHKLDTTELDTVLTDSNQYWKESGSFSPPVAKQLESALKSYKGAFLEGFYVRNARGFEGWKLLEHERIRFKVVESLYRLGSNALKQGQYTDGIAHITQLLQYDPLWEEAHRLLMLLLTYSGNRSAALAQYEICQRLLKENLDVAPSDETFDLYCQIDDGAIKPNFQERIPHNLPMPATSFVGRSIELNQITTQLNNPDCRLLTLIGPGGVGKTRLALEVARQNLSIFPQGVYLIDLSSVAHRERVVQTIADTLQLKFTGNSEPLLELIKALYGQHLLLILDNIEHLVEEADIVGQMLVHCEHLKILVTSTSRLNLQEEWLYPVQGFTGNAEESAIGLFAQTAQRVKRDFAFESQRGDIAEVCNLVDGLPLGIELAASWVHTLSCQQIAEQIRTDPDFLSTSLRNLPERHRSLKVLFEQAINSLDSQSRNVLLRLSVFQGGFGWEAARQVAGASLAMLASLVEKSLLRTPESDLYQMHMLINRYAYALLEQSEFLAATENGHLHYYTELAEKFAKSNDDLQMSLAYSNLETALYKAAASPAGDNLMRLANALTFYWRRRGYLSEGRQWFTQALAISTTDMGLLARTLANAGILAWNQSDFAAAHSLLTKGLHLYRDQHDQDGICYVLRYLGYVALNQGEFGSAQTHFEEILHIAQELAKSDLVLVALGNLGQVALEQNDLERAKSYIEESLQIARQHGGPENVGILLNNLGNIHLAQNNYARASHYYEESLSIARSIGHQPSIAFALVNLGEVAHNLGDLEAALSHYRESIRLLKESGDQLSLTAILESCAFVLIDQGQDERAAQLLGSAEVARESLSSPLPPREQARYERYLSIARTHLEAQHFAIGWRSGRLLSLEQALSIVLA